MKQLKSYKFFLLLLVLLNIASLVLPPFIDTGEIVSASDGSTAVEAQVVSKDGSPVPQAQVSLSSPAVSGTTDSQGFVRLDNLAVPDKTQVEVTVTVTAAGYKSWVLQGAYLLSADTLKVTAELAPGETGPPEVVQSPAPRWLLTGQDQLGPTPGPANPAARIRPNYSDRNPPATIRVWRVSLGRVDTVSFDAYVKHVLPNEWIPSWQAESLKAGAMAVKTYGWYWTNFTKYPNQGYDIRDDTADQVYNPNVSYASTDSAVDAVASWRMTRSSAIFQAHFCAGVQGDGSRTDTHCGNTPGNWLSQWGTQYWAQQGKDFNWILTYYYDNLALTQDIGQPEVVLDNSDTGFTANFTQHAWQTASGCSSVNGTFLYTGNTSTQQADHNEAYWRPALPQAGYYDVWVNVPACSATTHNAQYRVHYADGNTATVPLDQFNTSGFAKLGNWLFRADSTSYIYLDDVTGETSGSTSVGVDAIKWVYTGPPPVTLGSISVTPGSPTINQGTTQQFSATGYYSNGTTADITSSVSWSSTNTSVATINANGLASGVGAGSATIYATKDGKTGSTSLTVLQPAVGQGSAYPQPFIDAYTRRGGQATFGYPTDTVKQYGSSGVYWQPLGGNASAAGAIFYHQAGGANPANIRAYIISGGSYTYYMSNGGPSNSFGPPTSDEFQNAANYWQVNFANGYFADSGTGIHYTAWPTAFTAWKASYFNNAQLYSGPSLVQDEGISGSLALEHDWGTNQAPLPKQGLYFTDNWSARWERTYNFAAGYYKFTLCGDDGLRLILNDSPVINQWKIQGYTCYDYINGYSSATAVPLKIEYFQGNGGALMNFSVTSITPAQVTESIDNGGAGTLSYLLNNPPDSKLITFADNITNISFSGVTSLPALKTGVTLLGTCTGTGPKVTIDGTGVSGDGLTLLGSNQLSGIWVKNFGGKQLVASGPGNLFSQSCMKVSKT